MSNPKHALPYNWQWEKDLWKLETELHGRTPHGTHAQTENPASSN